MPVSTHAEHAIVPGRRLGRRPRDTGRATLKLGKYLTGNTPAHPPVVDYFTRVPRWVLGANDSYGTCGPTSVANLILLVSTWLGDSPVTLNDSDVYDLYRRSGNPDFDPATGAGDNGVDMTVMLSAAVKGGIGGVTPLAFAEVNGRDPDEVWAAGALFGGTLWGTDLSTAQQNESAVWDYRPGAADWGGHAVLAAGRYTDQPGTTGDRTGLVSWATQYDATDTFITRQVPERYVVIFDWHLRSRVFQRGVNLDQLAQDYTLLTGRPFPAVPPAPSPSPTPSPDSADRDLVTALGSWAAARHIGTNADAARAFTRWRQLKGL